MTVRRVLWVAADCIIDPFATGAGSTASVVDSKEGALYFELFQPHYMGEKRRLFWELSTVPMARGPWSPLTIAGPLRAVLSSVPWAVADLP